MKTEKIGRATIHNMDCMDFLKCCEDNQFDLAIVDPPYGIKVGGSKAFGKVGGSNIVESTNYRTFDDSDAPDYKYFMELRRISKNMIIWGANHFIERLPFGINSPCWIVWDKDNSGNFADCELAWTSFKTAVRKFKFRWNGLLQQDMKNKEKRIHPTQKPVALYEWLLKNYAKEGDSILDTHMGSGSIGIATNKHGFDLTACELDADYFTAACDRIKQAYNQPDMFTPQETKPEQAELL